MLELRDRLLQIARDEGILVEAFPISFAKALLAETSLGYCIALDPFQIRSVAEEVCLLAHELGHCLTGSLYGIDASPQSIGRCEHRATAWAARTLCPPEKLRHALATDCRTPWELAEELSLPEPLIAFALGLYRRQHLL